MHRDHTWRHREAISSLRVYFVSMPRFGLNLRGSRDTVTRRPHLVAADESVGHRHRHLTLAVVVRPLTESRPNGVTSRRCLPARSSRHYHQAKLPSEGLILIRQEKELATLTDSEIGPVRFCSPLPLASAVPPVSGPCPSLTSLVNDDPPDG